MESLIKSLVAAFLILGPLPLMAAEKPVARLYFQDFMGHVHQKPEDSSTSLTAIQCSHPLQVLEKPSLTVPDGWTYVKAGEDKGYVRSKFLGEKRPECFQEKYPKFYNNLHLDLSDYYYWGRLSDHYIEGESLAQ